MATIELTTTLNETTTKHIKLQSNGISKLTSQQLHQHDYIQPDDIRIKINGKWLELSKEFVEKHPGGSVINQYRNADATHIFHAFHEGSHLAYKQLKLLEANAAIKQLSAQQRQESRIRTLSDRRTSITTLAPSNDGVVEDNAKIGSYDLSIEHEIKIVENFERLRQRIHAEGLMDDCPLFYVRKLFEVTLLMSLSFFLQYSAYYLCSALVLALCWQQMGWLCHEFCHHQPLKNRKWNDWISLMLGNVAQGFSRNWWKDKHNIHHAATNIVEQDCDIDLAPLIAMVPHDLRNKYKQPLERLILKLVPYQHLYFTLVLPLLRFSWTAQSIEHVLIAASSQYDKDRRRANAERFGLALHWSWVLLQLYLLPSWPMRIMYFGVSQVLGGLFIALVVTYNHNSVDKFPENSRLLNNFACLHIFTTRNMRPSAFVDWFWGGLNYQIEHHLFPTMPRPNLTRCSELVKEFCAENELPYLVNDYWTGYSESLRLLKEVGDLQHAKQSEVTIQWKKLH